MTKKQLLEKLRDLPDDIIICSPGLEDDSNIIEAITIEKGNCITFQHPSGDNVFILEAPTTEDLIWLERHGFKEIRREKVLIIE